MVVKTAQNLYHCRGWIAHHNIDIWRTTWPVGGSGLWAILPNWRCLVVPAYLGTLFVYTRQRVFEGILSGFGRSFFVLFR